ncbi:type II toxin-antitoxin system HicA family toxin [Plantibacter sp. VKM Ac-2885]|uniref:type II toxin-antitoxin system HicA family toxin n=1 Tax=Plantibacter sp. VKM Ac-2885 TaxID=2783828 RepID=UPI00188C4FAF|nr:type II toxin-antitoxin system HicA family toxin [Plantibacter sp. VKM Ac-2885]MBF4511326.1 type II toxin-antitoxin system HicA family toxin [Plantibacter sp. VKM Ac-2885]
MVSEQPTRIMLKKLRKAGFTPAPNMVGSHRKWYAPNGVDSVSIPEGHKAISPGVVRQIDKAIEESK